MVLSGVDDAAACPPPLYSEHGLLRPHLHLPPPPCSRRGLIVLDGVDDAAAGPLAAARPLIAKLLTTKELRVLCTARDSLELEGERVFEVQPLHPHDAARLFRDLAIEALPPELRNASALLQHPVLKGLGGMPRAICQAAPVLRQGATLADLEREMFPPPPPPVVAPPQVPVPALAAAIEATRVSVATSPLFLPRFGAAAHKPSPPFSINRQPARVPPGGPTGSVLEGGPQPPAVLQHADSAPVSSRLFSLVPPPNMARSRTAHAGLTAATATEPAWGGASPSPADPASGIPPNIRTAPAANATPGQPSHGSIGPVAPLPTPTRPLNASPLPPPGRTVEITSSRRFTVGPHSGLLLDSEAGPPSVLDTPARGPEAAVEVAALVPVGAVAVLLPDPMQEMVRKTLEVRIRETNWWEYRRGG